MLDDDRSVNTANMGTPPPTSPLGSVPGAPPQAQPNISTPSAAPQPSPAEQMASSLQAADTQHHTQLGRAFRSIMGNEVSYQINPQTGKMEQTEVPQKPGQLWRSILAGVITGGAAAARAKSPGFIRGAATGGEAVLDKTEQQDKLKREQAQQDFKNQQQARSANTEEDMKRADIALHNAKILESAKLARGMDMKYHEEMAEHGKIQIQPFIDAGLTPMFKDVSDYEMLKADPDALKEHSKYKWFTTGTTTLTGHDGKPEIASTHTAYDPAGTVELPKKWIDEGKKYELDKFYGETWKALEPSKKLTVEQFGAMNQQLQQAKNNKNKEDQLDLNKRKEEADIKDKLSTAKWRDAEAAKAYADLKAGKKLAAKEQAHNDAILRYSKPEELDKNGKVKLDKNGLPTGVGGDFSKLPAGDQLIIQEGDKADAQILNTLHKTLVDSGQIDEAKKVYKRLEETLDRGRYHTKQSTSGGKPASSLNEIGQQYVNTHFAKMGGDDTLTPIKGDEKDAGMELWTNPDIPADQKIAITKQTGLVVPWFAVEEFSARVKLTPEEGAKQLKAGGIKVGEKTISRQPNVPGSIDFNQ